jgi:hypothetical protein
LDSLNRISRTGQAARTRQPGQEGLIKTARTGKPRKDYQDGIGGPLRTGQGGYISQDRAAIEESSFKESTHTMGKSTAVIRKVQENTCFGSRGTSM